ncbi:Transglutaminase-like superfamily protein [Chitinophaga sp. CF118]|uniref:transglutaminase-like domain-containing protein n=1 Tax=Chitinophaga sp. CF118 TaxID=1884367 RepID=UPI0008F29C31|nr:transglutaminase-like domain-containing protein [Chitinophaga sp. CF118]SFD14943.1 Transglutaminase-like superfamily protein [Chitinophaga sp. CF118]
MIKQLSISLTFMLSAQLLFAQKELPVIRATGKSVNIRDGNNFKKNGWTIAPEIKPDIYFTKPIPGKTKKVTFYTDIDSISFDVKTNSHFLFNIVLNNKDTALTGIMPSYDTLGILKRAGKYNYSEKRDLPAFTYQSADNPNLQALKKAFNLDSIAGGGNEASKILNLLHWIHNLVPHDGNHGNPASMNAMDMIAVCKKDQRGLNCRGLAMTLNECYLSLGIKSRYVTCMPKDSLGVDNDCHVINMVYLTQQKKWIWIDPTNDAYVMNEKGELLGIEEVRARIVNNKPLILNPEANWNHKVSYTKGYYLYSYMAKNLYLLETPLNSQFDLETRQAGKTINSVQLIPLDSKKSLDKSVSTNNTTKVTWVTYKTNNPDYFWQVP